ncbi:uncharacterized protein EI90DRAFT_3038787 [Cantharellus anzutake]|uniref:uncharacterized protein n=1 Tax=Cantharellus anzutake TaxID=1750568 RepID=UPI001906910E|nr:uncharacterized protein EI90DRAFT_3038787 [Cantharellus anzutake]KAF8340010.1 hypothetical protein EI90DRAFT_3038787 [Cantharellus anzutake]
MFLALLFLTHTLTFHLCYRPITKHVDDNNKKNYNQLPDDPLSPLCNFMLSSPTGTKGGEPASDKAGVVSHAPVVAPSAKSALEVLQLLESGRI